MLKSRVWHCQISLKSIEINSSEPGISPNDSALFSISSGPEKILAIRLLLNYGID